MLYVPSADHNPIPTVIKRSGSVTINDFPKINCDDPIVDDHSVSFENYDLCVHFQLNGVFSCFHMREPAERELNECDNIFLITDSSDCNPQY